MEGNGAVDYLNPDGSEGELVGASVEDCITACPLELGCVGFKRKPNDGNKCFSMPGWRLEPRTRR